MKIISPNVDETSVLLTRKSSLQKQINHNIDEWILKKAIAAISTKKSQKLQTREN